MDIQVGDRVTYKNLEGNVVTTLIVNNFDKADIKKILETREFIKIERTKFEVIKEKKELLTEEEKEFLKQYIKIIENLNNGKVIDILRGETRIRVYLETGLDYYIEVGPKFSNMKIDTSYTLSELGLE